MQKRAPEEDLIRKETRALSNETLNQNMGNAQESPRKKRRGLDIIAYFLCLLVAFGIWAYVTSTEAEEYEYQFTGILVDLEGVGALMSESNLSPISGEGNVITVTVKGSRREISKYSAEDIVAYVDLSAITTANRHNLDVHIDLPGNIQLVSAEPARISVFVDEIVEKQIPTKIDLLYSVENNITVLPAEIDDEDVVGGMITVTGPKTVIDYIDYALIKKDLGKISTGVKFNSQFSLVDKAGDTVTNPYVKTDVEELSVNVKVTAEKMVPIHATYTKDPNDPNEYSIVWKYDGTVIDTVKIVGDPMVISGYEAITIEINNVSNINNGSAAMPDNLWVYIGENKISTISYTVNKIVIENQG